MTAENPEFALTNHIIIRYAERSRVKRTTKKTISHDAQIQEILDDVKQATENRAIRNNTHFMTHIVDTYGDERYSIYVSEVTGMVYVVVNKPDVRLVLTCYHRDTSSLGHLRKRRKF